MVNLEFHSHLKTEVPLASAFFSFNLKKLIGYTVVYQLARC